jgi:hypothetical protein
VIDTFIEELGEAAKRLSRFASIDVIYRLFSGVLTGVLGVMHTHD